MKPTCAVTPFNTHRVPHIAKRLRRCWPCQRPGSRRTFTWSFSPNGSKRQCSTYCCRASRPCADGMQLSEAGSREARHLVLRYGFVSGRHPLLFHEGLTVLPHFTARTISAIPITRSADSARKEPSRPTAPPVSHSGPSTLLTIQPGNMTPELAMPNTPACMKFQLA